MIEKYYATGKRKVSIAKVWIFRGSGVITINNKSASSYFKGRILEKVIYLPFLAIDSTNLLYDAKIHVSGGGLSGQANAICHGIAKALLVSNNLFRILLKKKGFLTRDSRMVERKKYGQAGARKKFQYSKR